MAAHAATPGVDELLAGMPEGEKRTLAEVFFRRAVPLLRRMVEDAPARVLKESLTAPTDVGTLARFLTDAAEREEIRALDPLAAAFARGAVLQEELLEKAGGTWGVTQVAEHLKVSRQAVDKRRRRGTLLAVEIGDSHRYPLCQFNESGVIDGLPEVLQAIQTESGWTRLSLLFSHTLQGDDRSLLDAVRAGQVEDALHAARGWGKQAAA
jgi:hypothetical protein